jgi:pyridoxamine 5'-phosphate oxidase
VPAFAARYRFLGEVARFSIPPAREPTLPNDPIAVFAEVYARAVGSGAKNPEAMVLATVGLDGRPATRVVLLRGFDDRGFVFYTNLESRKGEALRADPNVSLNFYWPQLDTQVVVAGAAEPVSDAEADAYFATRPRLSQLGAWASRQSRPLPSRARLLADVARHEARFLGQPVPRPPHWSGFRVVPRSIEIWKNRPYRLHERDVYERDGDGWRRSHLYP